MNVKEFFLSLVISIHAFCIHFLLLFTCNFFLFKRSDISITDYKAKDFCLLFSGTNVSLLCSFFAYFLTFSVSIQIAFYFIHTHIEYGIFFSSTNSKINLRLKCLFDIKCEIKSK